jgi:hypothetical protein
MIHYDLLCEDGHAFDGWFKGSSEFDRLARAKLLTCPQCGGSKVDRAMMAPRIGKHGRAASPPMREEPTMSAAAPMPSPTLAGPIPDGLRAVLAKLREEVEARCDYLGSGFAEEARKIHEGSAPARGIYGEATPDDIESLLDDGIDITPIPWVPRSDS